jgi:hypothetical protein
MTNNSKCRNVTLASEVAELRAMLQSVKEAQDKTNNKLDLLTDFGKEIAAMSVTIENLSDRVEKGEQSQAKITLAVITSIISGIIAFVFRGGMK